MKMKKLNFIFSLMLVAGLFACNPFQLEEVVDPNNPSVGSVSNNATREQIQFLITGLEDRHRAYVFNVTAAWGTFGREVWYLNGSDPRFQTDWLGQGGRTPDAAYFGFGATGGGSYASPYQAINQAKVLIQAAENSGFLTSNERNAVKGFAKTIQGYQFMIPANFVYQNGIRIDVADPLNPGPFVPYNEALNFINNLLNDGYQDLQNASATLPFNLTSGFAGFNNAQGLARVNRAIAARLAVYRQDWQGALTALQNSFMNLSGDLNAGPRHTYGAPPDQFNPLYFVPNALVNTMIVVHPSLITDATPGDKRVTDKFFQRTTPVTVSTDVGTLQGFYQDRRWAANTSAVPFIKNEELILIKAEAHARLGQAALAVEAINVIRNAAGIGPYTGATTEAALINEILYQRRYSLWAEPWGHRWIDARRYNRLNQIPVNLDGGTVFTQFPHPQAELNWDSYRNSR